MAWHVNPDLDNSVTDCLRPEKTPRQIKVLARRDAKKLTSGASGCALAPRNARSGRYLRGKLVDQHVAIGARAAPELLNLCAPTGAGGSRGGFPQDDQGNFWL
jgi:hypothetical protein